MTFLEYAPAPESQAILNLRERLRPLHRRRVPSAAAAPRSPTISPATEKHIATIANANEADVDAAVAAARRAYDRTWSRSPAATAASTCSASPASCRSAARELAVAESLDNGKPIKESRDVDVPLVAAWFFYYAGWADKLDHAGLGAAPGLARRRRAGDPVELPAADAGVEDRPGAGRRQHGRAQAGRDHVAHRAAVRRDRAAGRPAARRGQHHHRRGRHRSAALVGHGDVDKVAFTGSTVGRPRDRPVRRRHRQEADPRARRQGREHRVRRRADRPGHRGHRQRHLLQPGPRLLRGQPPAGAGDRSTTRSSTGSRTRLSTLRLGDPLDKNTDIGAINSAEQLERIRELSDVGEAEGAERWTADCAIPENGFWFAPTIFTNVSTSHRIAREEIFGPVLSRADVPHPRGGHRQGEQHARTASPRASGPTRAAASSPSPTSSAPA